MKHRSISTKLFLLTSGFIVALITLMMVLQLTFFESYYEWTKKTKLQEGMNALQKNYTAAPDKQGDLLVEFEKEYGATVAVAGIDPKGNFRIQLITNNSTRRKAVGIDANGNIINVAPDRFEEFGSIRMMTGTLDDWKSSPQNYLQVTQQRKTVAYTVKDNPNLRKSIVSIAPLNAKGDVTTVLVAVSSLQPVGEASAIVKDFYVYYYIMAIIFVVLLAFVFSNMISKRLIRLNKAATRMAKLDFTAKCDEDSRDEIGSLGGTLNFLSQNLSNTLGQLHEVNSQLKQDIEKEKQLEKLRREFVAGVSHELKTPISLIYGYAEGLRDGIVQGGRRDEYIDVIMGETERMTTLVSDMLDLTQLETGKFKFNPAPFCLDDLIRSTADKWFVELNTHAISCELILPEEPVIVVGDSLRIEQVLKNLFSNAIQHTPQGGLIRVELNTEAGTEFEPILEHGCAVVTVFNNGDPIPDEAIPYLWDTFYKVEKSRNRELGGTGIGLAIVKNIMSLHHCSYGVRNDALGVTFYFTLPLLLSEDGDASDSELS
jgi:two-component system sensor histidine kinase VanS